MTYDGDQQAVRHSSALCATVHGWLMSGLERAITGKGMRELIPAGANEENIKATYDKGILTVDVAVPEQAAAAAAEKHIAMQATS